jgi:TonB family protein
MVKIDKQDVERLAVSSLGAAALSAACLFAALAPAKAEAKDAAPMTMAAWQHKVENRLDTIREQRGVAQPETGVAVSQVAVHLTPEGKLIEATIAKSSGSRALDHRAITVARALRFPALPEGFRNGPAKVRMTLYFGPDGEAAAERDRKKGETIQLAAM